MMLLEQRWWLRSRQVTNKLCDALRAYLKLHQYKRRRKGKITVGWQQPKKG